ncbi:uncharacterized protein CC84DRAFT_1168111 [Paraphaeosphaeria sporulosa]|uniref:Uncharacterized protein n=1 Tax=Paraphaeosphaeria sporulosa TaxID=1460663 RepID=A0A177C217_9PLEO|nr:uncharacterized protein CC84DRAFT_1168111 [Paraphaeosphaeria sporulosa]OAG00892.1 hypothetical protein CC84DRAFT_1168111 [Paraphaeosphaeria sporulosa]
MRKSIDDKQITPVSPAPTYVVSFPQSCTISSDQSSRKIPPFDQSQQLCEELEYAHGVDEPACLRSLTKIHRLPDAPRTPLDSRSIITYCLQDLDTPALNKLNRRLWNCGANPYVKTLSHQLTFERRIVVTEDPSLHLCSYAFWEHMLDPTPL